MLLECGRSSHRFSSQARFDPKRHEDVSHSESFAKIEQKLLSSRSRSFALFAGHTLSTSFIRVIGVIRGLEVSFSAQSGRCFITVPSPASVRKNDQLFVGRLSARNRDFLKSQIEISRHRAHRERGDRLEFSGRDSAPPRSRRGLDCQRLRQPGRSCRLERSWHSRGWCWRWR